jgi:peroxiredoxin
VPHLNKLHTENKDKGLVLIGVHSKNGGDKMEAFVKEQKIAYPVAHDSEGKTLKSYGGNSFPDYFLIDRAGNLRFADLANGELDRAVAALLAEDAPEDDTDGEAGSDDSPEKPEEGDAGQAAE